MNKTFFLFITIILLFSCKEDDNNAGFVSQSAIAEMVSLPDTVSMNENINLRISIGTPNPCYLFDGYKLSSVENRMSVSFFTKYKQDEICIHVTGRIDTLVQLRPLTTGLNILTLNPNTNFEIVDTIFVTN